MNQLAVIDDQAARRTAAARKAWETRRLQGWAPAPPTRAEKSTSAADALAAFEREAASDMPDWHSAALKLRAVLDAGRQKERSACVRTEPRPLALPPVRWHDYPVDRVGSFHVRADIMVVTFADGMVVRAPAVSAKGKPTNVGRGLRIAVAFYQARICKRQGLRFAPGFWSQVPAIAACICEDSGEIFDAEQCTVRTVEARKAQDWRIKNDRRRIEATPS